MFQYRRFFSTNGQPTDAFATLLKHTKLEHDGTVVGINAAMQAAWFHYEDGPDGKKTRGKFRKDIGGDKPTDHEWELLKPLGVRDDICIPTDYEATHVHLYGATVKAVRKRLMHGMRQHAKAFDVLTAFGNERPLSDDEVKDLFDPSNAELPFDADWRSKCLLSLPKRICEADMLEMVLSQAANRVPWDPAKHAPVVRIPDLRGTEDGIRLWLDKKPAPGHILGFSSQPHVWDQEMAVRRLVPPRRFSVECIGPKGNRNLAFNYHLNAITTLIYKAVTEPAD